MSPPAPLQRPALVAVGCCLLAVLAAGVGFGALPGSSGAPAPEIVDDGNTSNYLQPPSDGQAREGSTVHGVGVGVSVAADGDALEGTFERGLLDYRLAAEDTREDSLDRLQGATRNLSERSDRLRSVARTTRGAYRSGALSEQELFPRLARLEVAADRASRYREQMRRNLEEMGARSRPVYLDVQGLQPDIETLQGPVTDQLVARYAGNVSANSTYVRVTGQGGYVMSTVSDGRLYREAQVSADWNRDGVDRFANDDDVGSFTRARTRAAELYPWAFTHQVGVTNPPGWPSTTSLYKVISGHQHGQLTTYLDGATTDVFRELQTKHLEAIPWNWRRSASAGDLQLNVSGTNPTGAMEVQVTRPGTDVGVDSRIRVDGRYVGETDANGRLWTVQPSGGFTVNATSGADNVTLAVPEQTG